MKRILFALSFTVTATALTLALIFTFAPPAHADLWTLFKNSQLNPVENVKAYRIPAQGFDVRAYEWNPVSDPSKTCVIAFGQTDAVGMQCFTTAEEE